MKKYLKDYKNRGFVESEEPFDAHTIRIIDIESYLLPKCKYSSYFEDEAAHRFFEIGVLGTEILTREGPIGGLGFQSRRNYANPVQAENSYFDELKKWKQKGYKEVLSGAGYPTLKQALLDLEKQEGLEQQRKQAMEKQGQARGPHSVEEKVFIKDYQRYLAQGPYREAFGEWPACLEHLSPDPRALSSVLPDFIRDSFREQGIVDEASMKIPVRITALLGECPAHQFVSCPNIPEYYYDVQYKPLKDMDEQALLEKGMGLLSGIGAGRFYWFDAELTHGSQGVIPLRAVYNPGDPDSNEGFFGALWHRDSRQLVADILSAGGDQTLIRASEGFSRSATFPDTWLPLNYDAEKYPHKILQHTEYSQGLAIEKLVHLMLVLHRFMA